MALQTGNFSPGYQATISVNGQDISYAVESVTPAIKRKTDELPRLGGNQIQMLVGPPKTELKLKGWADPVVTNALLALVLAPIALLVPIVYNPQPANGGATRSGTGYVADYDEPSDAKNPNDWTATIVVNGDWV